MFKDLIQHYKTQGYNYKSIEEFFIFQNSDTLAYKLIKIEYEDGTKY